MGKRVPQPVLTRVVCWIEVFLTSVKGGVSWCGLRKGRRRGFGGSDWIASRGLDFRSRSSVRPKR